MKLVHKLSVALYNSNGTTSIIKMCLRRKRNQRLIDIDFYRSRFLFSVWKGQLHDRF